MMRSLLMLSLSLVITTTFGASAPVAAACIGDCNDDGGVTVNELIVGVNIALERADVGDCGALDANDDSDVRVDELVRAVQSLLVGCPQTRLIALSRDGKIATLDAVAPWTSRGAADLGATIASARCRAGRCLIAHPTPADSISVVDAADLSRADPIVLDAGADPRDVVFVDDRTVLVSQYGKAAVLLVDLDTRKVESIDLSALADDDGVPEALRMAVCGRRVFVQLRRVDAKTGEPSPLGAALAVIDTERQGADRVVDVDASTRGVQGIALAGRPNFDMPIDCGTGMLYVAEPEPLFQGGGAYEQVDLTTLTASAFPIDTGAQVGGFEVVAPGLIWQITHTDFGPGASSHLTLTGGTVSDTHNTFATEHVEDLALDRDDDLLFFPDPCAPGPANESCDTGVHVFHAHSGERASPGGVDVGFAPIEVVVSR